MCVYRSIYICDSMHYVYVCIYVCITDMCMCVYKIWVNHHYIKKVGLELGKEDMFKSINSD